MSEKTRSEIAGMLTDREIEELGAPWLSMAQAPVQPSYGAAITPREQGNLSRLDVGAGITPSEQTLTLEGYGSGALDRAKRVSPHGGMRLRYGRPF